MTQCGPFGVFTPKPQGFHHLVKTLHVYILCVPVAPLRGLCPSRLAQDGMYSGVPISLVHNRSLLERVEYSLAGVWLNKAWSVFTVEYYASAQKHEVLEGLI